MREHYFNARCTPSKPPTTVVEFRTMRAAALLPREGRGIGVEGTRRRE